MESYQENNKKNLKNISIGIGISIFITAICLFVFSILLTYTNLSENTITPTIIIITGISVLIGSSIGNVKIKKNGIINGAIIGGGYILILYLISSLINVEFTLNFKSIIMIIVGILFGIFGGSMGVNSKLCRKKWKNVEFFDEKLSNFEKSN